MAKGKVVSIPCPECSKKAKVSLGQISKEGIIFSCSGCQTKLKVKRTEKGVSVRKLTPEELGEDEEEVADKEIIIKGAPTWIVTFADLATLLLTFFVLMLSFASMDIAKFKDLKGSVQNRYGVAQVEKGIYQAVSTGNLDEVDSNISQSSDEVAREILVNIIYDIIIRQGMQNLASITSTDEGVRIRVRGRAVFKSGSAQMEETSMNFLKDLSTLISGVKDVTVVVEGHTDNRPVKTKRFPSNWELSVLRASAVLEQMIKLGAPARRMSAIGFADTRPLFPNDRDETRILNRRVEFLLKNNG